MLDPALESARLSLALAYARLGETTLARALAAPWSERGLASAQTRLTAGLTWASNRTYVPAAEAIRLTVPGDTVRLPLATARSPGLLWRWQVERGSEEGNRLWLALDAPWDGVARAQRLGWRSADGWFVTHQRWEGRALLTEAGRRGAWGEWSVRHWHDEARRDGVRVRLSPFAEFSALQFLADAPIDAHRPGGWRLGGALGGSAHWQWQGAAFRAEVSVEHWRDTRAYSPWLSSGARRWVTIHQSSLTVTPVHVRHHLQPYVRLWHEGQASNLALFRVRNTSVEVGLVWFF